MKIYRLAVEYYDIGHKQVKSLISIWQMQRDGTILEKVVTFPDPKESHLAIFGPDENKIIAEGRCDIGRKECSCAYYGEGHNQKEWIRSLLKEKFGQDVTIYNF